MRYSSESLQRATAEYSQRDEDQFRRELELRLSSILREMARINSGDSQVSSLTSKRENFLYPPVGIWSFL